MEPRRTVDRQTLRTLTPINSLRPDAFEELATKIQVEESLPDRRLFVRGQHDRWTFFILKGRVRLDTPTGSMGHIDGGTPAANRPLEDHQPRTATASTETRVRFIRIDRNLLEVLSRDAAPDSYALEELRPDDADPRNRLFYAIFKDYMADSLELPHLPEIAVRVRSATRDPDCDPIKVAKLIQSDPIISARLIQAANSPLYGVQTPIRSIRAAVMFLGLETTRNLVTTYALRELFTAETPAIRQRMTELWRHSAMTSSIAYVLAGMTPGLMPDWAMLAGLLHDVGALPIIHYAGKQPTLCNHPEALDAAITELRGQIGAMVLRRWDFGSEMMGILLEAEDWQRDPGDHPILPI